MIIKLTDSAGGSVQTLVHGIGQATDTYAQGPTGSGLTFDSLQEVQVTPLTRSEFAQVLPRSNHRATLPFGAMRCFTNAAAARSFAAGHVLNTQGLTRLKITDGAETITLHGALNTCRPVAVGVTVLINYEFTYGKVEVTSS